MNLIKQLELLGLSENQSKIYFALLESKKATVLQLARKIGIQRPTIYDNLSRLGGTFCDYHNANLPSSPSFSAPVLSLRVATVVGVVWCYSMHSIA